MSVATAVGVGLVVSGLAMASPAQAAAGTISATVFNDLDSDGVRDAGEGPVAGLTFTIVGSALPRPTTLGTATTDAQGRFTFSTAYTGRAGVYAQTETWNAPSVLFDLGAAGVDLTLPAYQTLSSMLDASIRLAGTTYRASKPVRFSLTITNTSKRVVTGIVARCEWDVTNVMAGNAPRLLDGGVTLRPGEKRTFALTGRLTSSAIVNHLGTILCGLSLPANPPAGGNFEAQSSTFRVTGGVSTVRGRYFGDTDRDGIQDRGETGISTDWEAIQLVDPRTKTVLATGFVSDEATGEFVLEVLGSVSRAELRLVEPNLTRTAPVVTVSVRVDRTVNVGAIPVTDQEPNG